MFPVGTGNLLSVPTVLRVVASAVSLVCQLNQGLPADLCGFFFASVCHIPIFICSRVEKTECNILI